MVTAAQRNAVRQYSMRNMPTELVEEFRVLAALERTSLETQIVEALRVGLKARKPDIYARYRKRAAASA